MKLRFQLTFKRCPEVVAIIEGQRDIDAANLNIGEPTDEVLATEQFLEKLTGLRVHIEQVN